MAYEIHKYCQAFIPASARVFSEMVDSKFQSEELWTFVDLIEPLGLPDYGVQETKVLQLNTKKGKVV